ncbi:MAG: IS5 family transposase [Fusobacteriaceae bacterium]
MAKSYRYKPKNWSAYNQSKVQQGNLFIWISEDIEDWWYDSMPQQGRGRAKRYSSRSVECCQTLRSLLHFPLRQTQGYFQGLFNFLNIALDVPNYTTIGRRIVGLGIEFRVSDPQEDLHVSIDSSGVRYHRGNNWHPEKHTKKKKQKGWLKVHFAVNAKTGEVVANTLSEGSESDSGQVEALLAQCPDLLEGLYADGAYDRDKTYQAIFNHQPDWPVQIVIPPIKTSTIPDKPWEQLNQRERHLLMIHEEGRTKWHFKNHYGRRNRSEIIFAIFKSIFGEKLLSRDSSIQKIEVDLKCKIMNNFNQFYQDGFVKVRI